MLMMKNWTVHVPGPCELLCLFLAVQTQHATDNDVAKLFAYFCQCNVFFVFFFPGAEGAVFPGKWLVFMLKLALQM